MTERAIKAGDVVQLRSGGPGMTVTSTRPGDGIATCMWFSRGNAHWHSCEFEVAALKRVGLSDDDFKDCSPGLAERKAGACCREGVAQ